MAAAHRRGRARARTAAWMAGTLAVAVCAGRGAAAAPANTRVLYDFEKPNHGWIVGPAFVAHSENGRAPAGKPAGILRTPRARSGRSVLRVQAHFPGDLMVHVQPNADWSHYDRLLLDIYLPADAPRWIQALFVIRDRDLWWYQAMPVQWLEPGKWQTISLDLSPHSSDWKAEDHMKAWDGYAAQRVRLFGIRLFSTAAYRGDILIDNVRGVEAAGRGDGHSLYNFATNTDVVPQYGKFEITFSLDRAYDNPFDPDQVEVAALITPPSGRTRSVPGFIYQAYQRLTRNGAGYLVPTGARVWKIRFAPTEVGKHYYRIVVRDGQTLHMRLRSFEVVKSSRRGPVRVSQKNWRYFEFANGDFFYPIGFNMHAPYDRMYAGFRHTTLSPKAGLAQYERIMPKMAANGLNFIEVWMSAWWLALEWSPQHNFFHGLGRYNLQNAWKLDKLLELADRQNMYVHLVVQNHGMLSLWSDSEWADNPYNQKQGGFLRTPEEFFTSPRAIELFKKKLRYIVARWGYSDRLFGLELMSELDLTGNSWSFTRSPAKVSWHRTMAAYIKQIAPHPPLVTTHYSSGYYREDPLLVGLPGIDYTVTDGYRADQAAHKDIVQVVHDTWRFNQQFKKPTFITEYGGRNSVESAAVLEMDLHCGMWASYVSPTSAIPLFWWFHFIEDENQYFRFRSLAAFDAGLDRRGLGLRPRAVTFAGDGGLLAAQCMAGPKAALLWIYDKGLPREKKAFKPMRGVNASFSALQPGAYRVLFWDTRAGRAIAERRVEVAPGAFTLELPEFTKDLACKILPAPGK